MITTERDHTMTLNQQMLTEAAHRLRRVGPDLSEQEHDLLEHVQKQVTRILALPVQADGAPRPIRPLIQLD
jgi:hypothetical protein